MVFSSKRASSKLLGIDKVFRMFWMSGMMCLMVRSSWDLLHIGGGSLIVNLMFPTSGA